jgi:hypothetical protein
MLNRVINSANMTPIANRCRMAQVVSILNWQTIPLSVEGPYAARAPSMAGCANRGIYFRGENAPRVKLENLPNLLERSRTRTTPSVKLSLIIRLVYSDTKIYD